jgi:hypothetical protein
MGIIEKIRLKILSRNDLREIERDVSKQEQLARRSDIASKKLKGALPRSVTRKEERLAELGIAGGRAEQSAAILKAKGAKLPGFGTIPGAPIQSANAFKNLEKQVAKQAVVQNSLQKAMSKIGLLGAAAANPGQAFASQGLAAATKFFLPAAVIVSIAQVVIDYWIQSYGKGGINDPRKKILDDVKSLIGTDREQDIIEGKLFFANSRTLVPGQETRSNTMNKRFGWNLSRQHRVAYGRGGNF